MSQKSRDDFFKTQVLGHPAGLIVLFFTEMWERFSFYGMRVLLVNFLTMAVVGSNPGWGWSSENAGALFGTYAGLLYLTPIIGGQIADKYTGYRWAVIIGSIIMTLGHAAMALDTELSLYLGLGLLVIGTGFFKPNITSIISEMYKDFPEKKDGAYTIFYMGVNSGAFFGMMLCGYLGEKIGWSWGFGLAGVFMLLGTLQFAFAKKLFGEIGEKPNNAKKIDQSDNASKDEPKLVPFTSLDKWFIVLSSIIGLAYFINDPMSKIGGVNIFNFSVGTLSGNNFMILVGLTIFLILAISRILRHEKVVRDRMFAFIIFAFFTVFFWMSFEQGATSLVIFARDFVDRTLVGSAAATFNIFNLLLTVIPLLIITWVLYLLAKRTLHKIALSNIILFICFGLIWVLVVWMLRKDFAGTTTEITVSWFSILNSFFIIAFASIISKWWDSKYNPSAAMKYGLGLIIMSIGFGLLSWGAHGLALGIKVSMVWLILAYLFHTIGELCLSPVGLSYVSKLVPPRMIALMFGMWYLAIAIGNKAAAILGGEIDKISEKYSLSTFFLICTVVPIGAGILIILLNPMLKRLMHGVK